MEEFPDFCPLELDCVVGLVDDPGVEVEGVDLDVVGVLQ